MGGGQSKEESDAQKARIASLEAQLAAQQLLLNPEQKPQNVLDPRAYNPDFAGVLASMLLGAILHTVFFGLANAGKSSAFNFFVRCITMGNFIGGHHVGQGTAGAGQFSTQCVRESLCKHFATWQYSKGDLIVADTVGFEGNMDEFRAICYGQMKQIEAFPRDASVASALLRDQIAKRPKQFLAAPIVVFISIDEFFTTAKIKARDDVVKSILKGAKEELRVGEFQVEVPVFVVLTKCDKIVCNNSNAEPCDLVHQRTAPRLEQVFNLCGERFGISKDNIFCLGWLDDADKADFSAKTTDPRVLAARSAIISFAKSARMAHMRFAELAREGK